MSTITEKEFIVHPLNFLDSVQKGEILVLDREGEPSAMVIPVRLGKDRPFGIFQGEFVVPPDFNDSMPEEELESFYGI